MRAIKKPVEITAYQVDDPTDINNGQAWLHAEAGDWVITGTSGEQYPCADDIFRATYDNVYDDVYRKVPVEVEVEQATDYGTIMTLEGPEPYEPTDWIVTGVHGEQYPVRDDVFFDIYELV